MTEHERTIGRLEAQVARLQTDVSAMDQGKGAKAALAVVSAAFGGIGATVAAWAAGIVGRG